MHPFVRAIARRVIPSEIRYNVSTAAIVAPNTKQFRTMLTEIVPNAAIPGRVVLVCGSLQPGGAERQVANTLIGLADASLESVTLLCDYLHSGTKEKYDFYLPLAQSSGAIIRTIRTSWDKLDITCLPPGLTKFAIDLDPNLITDITNLYLEFRALRPEVVHAWLDWSNVRAGLAAVLAGVPKILLSGRNLSPRHFTIDAEYFRPAYMALIERSEDQLILLNNSQAGANDYADWLSLPTERIRVIRNGVRFAEGMHRSPENSAAFRARHGVPIDATVVGAMFRFYPEKQPLLWLEAAGRIAQAIPDAHFMIFGDGFMRHMMEELIRALGIANRTHLCGIVTPSLDALSACDLILLTSIGEGTPNVLLEAQWLGLPVVTTEAGGAAEAILDGVTGIVVKTGRADDIANAVVGALRDANFRDVASREGRTFIAAKYGTGRMIDETLAAYQCGAGYVNRKLA